MTDTTFVSGTVITSEWLNFVNDALHGTEQLNLYVATTGSDSNDGLTVSTPFLTLQKAFDFLMGRGHLGGKTTVNVAAGTYTLTSSQRLGPANEDETDPNVDTYASNGINTVNWIVIQGPDVGYDPLTDPWPTPTAIIDCNSVAAIGIQLEWPMKVLVKNIKVKNATGIGVSADHAFLRCENVHTEECVIGISGIRSTIEVRGGWIYGNAGKTLTGIRSIFVNRHSIGNQAAAGAGQGPLISFCSVGLLVQESSVGHSDSVSYEDCTTGIQVTVNARVNYSYSDFKRCTRGIRVEHNSVVFGYTTAEFNNGTADQCDENIMVQGGARDVDRDSYVTTPSATTHPAHGDMPMTITGTTTNITVIEKELEAGLFAPDTQYSIRKPMHFRICAGGSIANTRTAGTPTNGTIATKQFKIRLGSTLVAGVTVGEAEYGDWTMDGIVVLQDTNVQAGSITWSCNLPQVGIVNGGRNTYVDVDTGTEDTKANTRTLSFEIQPQDVGDIYTVNYAHIELWG